MKIRTLITAHPAKAIGGAIALLTVIDVAVLVAIGVRHPQPNTLSYEVAKASLQVLVVVVFGGILSLASAAYQLREQDRRRVDDQRRDARQRCDALVGEFLRDVLSSYNTVKRARRVLQTWRWDPQQAGDLVEIYDAQLDVINDAQLDFERLKRTAPALGRCGVNISQLEEWFSDSETYLNQVLKEWQRHRRELVKSPDTAEGARAKLRGFIDTASFRQGIARPIGQAVKELQNALIAPDEPATWTVGPPRP